MSSFLKVGIRPQSGLTPITVTKRSITNLTGFIANKTKGGRRLDCTTQKQGAPKELPRLGNQGVEWIEIERKGMPKRHKAIINQMLALAFAATELPQALLSYDRLTPHLEIIDVTTRQVVTRKNMAKLAPAPTTTTASSSQASPRRVKTPPSTPRATATAAAPYATATQPARKSAEKSDGLPPLKFKMTKAEKLALGIAGGLTLAIAGTALGSFLATGTLLFVPAIIWLFGTCGALGSLVFYFIDRAESHQNFKGKGILSINDAEFSFQQQAQIRRALIEVRLGGSIGVESFEVESAWSSSSGRSWGIKEEADTFVKGLLAKHHETETKSSISSKIEKQGDEWEATFYVYKAYPQDNVVLLVLKGIHQ
ncbi:MAG: hypothetical protein HQ596_07210 [Candidatus Saganbacteria bacterium]|nr:hypothetical protein [Candidatus Saganbacteria bacterium]